MTLSIIIPTYNDLSLPLAEALVRQAEAIDGLTWELLVGDDGSTRQDIIAQNRAINRLPHSRYLERQHNSGRAAIRNFLAGEAKGQWLLCIDGDARIDDPRYLEKMLSARSHHLVAYGGYLMMPGPDANLRWRYERAAAPYHTPARRQQQPYAAFNVSNLLIRRDLLLAHPLDETITRYGYEDVALGKALELSDIAVTHIDAPVAYYDYESNESYLRKTEAALLTLAEHQSSLRGYSRLLDTALRLHPAARWLLRQAFRPVRAALRRQLCSDHPSLKAFNVYKLGYLLQLLAHPTP